MSALDFMDSTGLGTIVRIAKRVKEGNGKLRLSNQQSKILVFYEGSCNSKINSTPDDTVLQKLRSCASGKERSQMPIEHKIDPETGIMHVRRWGHIDTQDEKEAFQKRSKDPLLVSDTPVIVECREVDPADSTEVVQYIADRTTRIAADLDCGPIAIIVSSDVEYGMARMYMTMTETMHPNTEVFRSYDEGLAWLLRESKKESKVDHLKGIRFREWPQ